MSTEIKKLAQAIVGVELAKVSGHDINDSGKDMEYGTEHPVGGDKKKKKMEDMKDGNVDGITENTGDEKDDKKDD